MPKLTFYRARWFVKIANLMEKIGRIEEAIKFYSMGLNDWKNIFQDENHHCVKILKESIQKLLPQA